jgi:hypothetical protein
MKTLRAVLRPFDTIGILQVIITGGVHDMTDIAFSRNARREIEAVRPGLAAVRKSRVYF